MVSVFGTMAADVLHVGLGVPYLISTIGFAVALAAAFWTAYVITRPLGASFADWRGVSHARGDLGLGTGPVTAAWAVASSHWSRICSHVRAVDRVGAGRLDHRGPHPRWRPPGGDARPGNLPATRLVKP